MTTKRTWTDEEFIQAVQKNETIADVMRELGLVVGGANYKQVHLHVERLGLTTDHWKGRGHGKSNHFLRAPVSYPIEDILVEGSTYTNSSSLKRRLLKEGLLENKCQICGMDPFWNEQVLVFSLDHVNGDNRDNRLNNLRLLCPNCDSQTPTFRRAKTNRFSRFCSDCGKRISSRSKSGYCGECVRKHQPNRNQYTGAPNSLKCKNCDRPLVGKQEHYCSYECHHTADRKTQRPSREALEQELQGKPNWCALGRKYGVSDNAIRKWAKRYNLI